MDFGFRFLKKNYLCCFIKSLKEWRWSSDPTNGFVPPGRRGHTAVFLEECKAIIIYGGKTLFIARIFFNRKN